MENKKHINGSDGRYTIYENGDIISHKPRWGTFRKLKGSISNTGHRVHNIFLFGEKRPWLLHRLIAEHFIPNLEKKPWATHKDGNKLNNAISNLVWRNASETVKHAWDIGLNKGATGIIGFSPKLTTHILQKSISGEIIKEWDSQMSASRELGIRQEGISRCCRGERKTFKNCHWEFKLNNTCN